MPSVKRTPVKHKVLSSLSVNTNKISANSNDKNNQITRRGEGTKRKRCVHDEIAERPNDEKCYKHKLSYYTFDTPVGEFYAFVNKEDCPNAVCGSLFACGWISTTTTITDNTSSKANKKQSNVKVATNTNTSNASSTCSDNQQCQKEELYLKKLQSFYNKQNIDFVDDTVKYNRSDCQANMCAVHQLYDYFHAVYHEPLLKNTIKSNTPIESPHEDWSERLNMLLDSILVHYPPNVSEYTRTVWEVLRDTVKAGNVTSYKMLAELTCNVYNRKKLKEIEGNNSNNNNNKLERKESKPSPRGVGKAMATNPVPIVVPCHRVLSQDMHLHGYGPGLHRKVWLLQHERANVNSHILSLFAHDERSYE